MRRRSALRSEIIGSANDALAEVILPDAVNEDTRSQRMIGLGEPSRQRQASASVVPLGLWLGGTPGFLRIIENSGYSGLNRIARIQLISAIENPGRRRILRDIPQAPDPLGVEALVLSLVLSLLGCQLREFGILFFKSRIVGRIRRIVVIARARLLPIFREGGGDLSAQSTDTVVRIFNVRDPLLALIRLDIQHVARGPRAVRER